MKTLLFKLILFGMTFFFFNILLNVHEIQSALGTVSKEVDLMDIPNMVLGVNGY